MGNKTFKKETINDLLFHLFLFYFTYMCTVYIHEF